MTTETTEIVKRTPQEVASDFAEQLHNADKHATPLPSATRDALSEFMQAVCDVLAPAAPAAPAA